MPALILRHPRRSSAVPAGRRSRGTSPPLSDIVLQITAKQFNWRSPIPGPDGKFGTADDKTLTTRCTCPVNKVVPFILRSRDVIHSFFVPQFRFKQDAVPGREICSGSR